MASAWTEKETSMIPTLRPGNLANVSTECFRPEDLSIQLKHQQGFPISKSVLENYLFPCIPKCFMLSSLLFAVLLSLHLVTIFFLMFSVLSTVILSPCRLHKEAETVLQKYCMMTEQITRHRVWIFLLWVYNVCVPLQTCKPLIIKQIAKLQVH